jgi:hypothetical protein
MPKGSPATGKRQRRPVWSPPLVYTHSETSELSYPGGKNSEDRSQNKISPICIFPKLLRDLKVPGKDMPVQCDLL